MLSASIVLYNTSKTEVNTALDCALNSAIERIYILDNSDNDKFRILEKRSPKIRYIHNKNLGYGASHNIALREAIDEGSVFHLVLNPDVRFTSGVITALTAYMEEHTDTAYILPKVLYPDGETQYLCKLLPTSFNLIFRRFMPDRGFIKRINEQYVLKNSGYDKIINPPCLSGCFMFLRVSTIKEHNLFFDERFFMYCEDVDLIRRIHRITKTVYYPAVSIIHDHSKASYKSRKMLFEHIKSVITYFNKWGWFFDRERREMNKRILEEIAVICKNA